MGLAGISACGLANLKSRCKWGWALTCRLGGRAFSPNPTQIIGMTVRADLRSLVLGWLSARGHYQLLEAYLPYLVYAPFLLKASDAITKSFLYFEFL